MPVSVYPDPGPPPDKYARRVAVAGVLLAAVAVAVDRGIVEEQRSIEVSAVAQVTVHDETIDGYGVRLTLINEGLRPVIVEGADLRLEGEPFSTATQFLADTRALDRYALEPEAVAAELQPFPIVVDARGSRTVAAFFDLDEQAYVKEPYKAAQRRAHAFCKAVSGAAGTRRKLSVGLSLVPSDEDSFLSDFQQSMWSGSLLSAEEKIVPIRTAGFTTPRFGWFSPIIGPDHAPTGIKLSEKLSEPSTFRVIRLDVWGANVNYSVERPVLGARPTLFPLPRLQPGDYYAAFRNGSDVVAAGRLPIPLPSGKTDLQPSFEPAGPCGRRNLGINLES